MTKTTEKTTQPATAGNAESPTRAPDDSLRELPSFVLDALELAELRGWRFEEPGDTVAGALIATTVRSIPRLDANDNRDVRVALLYGIQLRSTGEFTEPHYIELVGYSTVLDRHLQRLENAEQGTLVRATYAGHKESATRGHSDYADFNVAIGAVTQDLPVEVLIAAPELPTATHLGSVIPTDQEPF